VISYFWCLGLSAGAADLIAPQHSGTNTSVAVTAVQANVISASVSRLDATTDANNSALPFYVTVLAVNGAGLNSTSSAVALYSDVPPAGGRVQFFTLDQISTSLGSANVSQSFAGTTTGNNVTVSYNHVPSANESGPPPRYQTNSISLGFQFSSFYDVPLPQLTYWFCVSTTAAIPPVCDVVDLQEYLPPELGPNDIIPPYDVGTTTPVQVLLTGLTLQDGGDYFVSVTAVNQAGLNATAVSDVLTIDATTPYNVFGLSILDLLPPVAPTTSWNKSGVSNANNATEGYGGLGSSVASNNVYASAPSFDVDIIAATGSLMASFPGWADPQSGISYM
jgi:hypothetical protein